MELGRAIMNLICKMMSPVVMFKWMVWGSDEEVGVERIWEGFLLVESNNDICIWAKAGGNYRWAS